MLVSVSQYQFTPKVSYRNSCSRQINIAIPRRCPSLVTFFRAYECALDRFTTTAATAQPYVMASLKAFNDTIIFFTYVPHYVGSRNFSTFVLQLLRGPSLICCVHMLIFGHLYLLCNVHRFYFYDGSVSFSLN